MRQVIRPAALEVRVIVHNSYSSERLQIHNHWLKVVKPHLIDKALERAGPDAGKLLSLEEVAYTEAKREMSLRSGA